MTTVTKLTLSSGDRRTLDDIVDRLVTVVERKGADLRGPHTGPPTEYSVPQSKTLAGEERFSPWEYTVYTRRLEIVGHDGAARVAAGYDFPPSIHVAVELDRIHTAGRSS
jgi:small subunit ribosomal protein S10